METFGIAKGWVSARSALPYRRHVDGGRINRSGSSSRARSFQCESRESRSATCTGTTAAVASSCMRLRSGEADSSAGCTRLRSNVAKEPASDGVTAQRSARTPGWRVASTMPWSLRKRRPSLTEPLLRPRRFSISGNPTGAGHT